MNFVSAAYAEMPKNIKKGELMKYFLTEEQRRESHSTCYFEFQRGNHNGEFWKKDSLSLHDDIFGGMELDRIFKEAAPDFDYFGTSVIGIEEWEKIKAALSQGGKEHRELLAELEPWVTDNFKNYDVFSVVGM